MFGRASKYALVFPLALAGCAGAGVPPQTTAGVTDLSLSATHVAAGGSTVNWSEFGFIASGSRFNSRETVLSPRDVHGLRKRWSFLTGCESNCGVDGSPAIVNGVVYIGSYDGNMYALNAANGSKQWSFLTGDRVFSSPAVVRGIVYLGSLDHNVYALNAATGAEIWSFTTATP